MNSLLHRALWCILVSCPAIGKDYIEADFNEKNYKVQVRHCFDSAPDYLKSKYAGTEVSEVSWKGVTDGFPLKLNHRKIKLPVQQKGCVHYLTGVDKDNRMNNSVFKTRHPSSVVASIDSWLLKTNDYSKRLLPEITINHSEKIRVSAPWKLIERQQELTRYQIRKSPNHSSGYVAFAPMEVRQVYLGKSRLRLAIMNGVYENRNDVIERWITDMAKSVAKVGQVFPLDDIQVLVIMMPGNGGPVSWGQVNRAGGQGVFLFVNPEQSESSLNSDWTAAHEFSHLLIPYTPNDRWLSEGFASYHQNISRLRSGLLDEKAAWQKLLAGFERGKKTSEKPSAPTLKYSGRKHNMQMYWGGAVIALKADVELQKMSQGQMSLSKALAGLKDCCLDTGRDWTARQLFKALDKLTQTTVFSTLYEQDVQRLTYPNYDLLLKDLGVRKTSLGQIFFDNQAPMAYIRQSIARSP